ncbi:hypothetical protein OG866_07020 [Streptomyces sp. NBC_00663]|uniref:hypothetical protein n=1 Tax=Streptomyces sp. NBC_00663 TaxID=2975801 RepID=UPI002E33A939|nr:hypothetical protein [Streptomyces sp. NBC_00663]
MAIRKNDVNKAISALVKAGMDQATAQSAWRLLDLSEPLAPQIAELAEEDPELFEPAEDDSDEDDTPMTPREAQRARMTGGHRTAATNVVPRKEGERAGDYVARVLVSTKTPGSRTPSTASAAAHKTAASVKRYLGNGADQDA